VGDSSDLTGRIAHLAAGQYGHLTSAQLRGTGVPASTIGDWQRSGRLVRIHQGVYAAGYRRVEPVARAMAAVLACGAGAVLSHDSALALWGLRPWPRLPELIVAGRVRRPGIVAHRSQTLTDHECTLQLGVPTTRAARAIADMHGRLTARQRVRLVNDARLAHILSAEEQAVLLGHDRNPTRSGGEDALQRFIEHHRLPQPLINVHVNGHIVDALWPLELVILEIDHPATHSDPATFASDRRHDREDRDLGYLTVRLTAADLTGAEARRLRRLILGRRPPTPRPA
jgi:hypothetical protein